MIQTTEWSICLRQFYMPLGHKFPLKAHVGLFGKFRAQTYNVYETCATVMQDENKCGDFEIHHRQIHRKTCCVFVYEIHSTLIGQPFLLNIEYDKLERGNSTGFP